ncbi:hypothetical protein [Bizionia arctica]|uniref:Uncharacterized protein n=1 Tax=Bizionia arctica TaxID=1495645 RepID=A0A917GXT7_9FLAO|nr:hypothetical protein [Bizionia arctica]GGG60550.1 hypothetical protein GCM10010976_34140 [Bizionia arctica]
MIFQQNLYSQKEIVGKVEFYKSIDNEWNILESFPDETIENLTNRNHKIQIIQKDIITELETESNGVFIIRTELNDSIFIKVNDHSPVLNENFQFDFKEIRDTLRLRISDKKLSIYRDSIGNPEFYNKYNEQQAELDFKNGKRELLGLAVCWPTEKSIEIHKQIEAEYGINYYYIEPTREKIKIMYRYNQVMKKLIGINKNVW